MTTQSIITLAELSDILKESPYRDHADVCQAFLDEINETKEMGNDDYEISARYTRSGNPFVVRF